MLVPLGPVFSIKVLDAGTEGFGLFIFALGIGVAIGVVLLSVFQRRIPKAEVFAGSLLVAGRRARSSPRRCPSCGSRRCSSPCWASARARCTCSASPCCTRASTTTSEVGSSSALYTLVRFCVLIAFAVGPFMSDLLESLSNRLFDGSISIGRR